MFRMKRPRTQMREMAKHCVKGAHDNVVSARPRGIRDAHGS
jgi:hypothetical protein